MRINKFVAQATGLSRRAADAAIKEGRVLVNGEVTATGYIARPNDRVTLDGADLKVSGGHNTIMLNKPIGYVVSRNGQGGKTIYDLLPPEYHHLKPVGRLDKDSSGLLLLTTDGNLANELTHPRNRKMKVYEIELDKALTPKDWEQITKEGVKLDDGLSKFELNWLEKSNGLKWLVTMHEGRNRQIRRTFASLDYRVRKLHRTHFGNYQLNGLALGDYIKL